MQFRGVVSVWPEPGVARGARTPRAGVDLVKPGPLLLDGLRGHPEELQRPHEATRFRPRTIDAGTLGRVGAPDGWLSTRAR